MKIQERKPHELRDLPFPDCYKHCGIVKRLGVGECENIEECDDKMQNEGGLNSEISNS